MKKRINRTKLIKRALLLFGLLFFGLSLSPKPVRADLTINFDDLSGALPFRTGLMGDWTSLTIGGIISALIPFIYVLAGIALLMMLIIGGFQLMTSGGDPKRVESGRNRVMYALIGFLIIFVSFWLVRVLQVIFGLPKIF